jgi:hypothetical protein
MTQTQLHDQLVAIIVKASARGDGRTVTPREADAILTALVASDDAPEWNECRQPGRDVLHQVIAGYYRPALAR